jgi:hypothetical protein
VKRTGLTSKDVDIKVSSRKVRSDEWQGLRD